MRNLLLLAYALSWATLGSSAFAATPHETFYHEGYITPALVASWSSIPGTRSYIINAGDPSAEELKPLAQLRGADRIQVAVSYYPSRDSLSVWQSLAAKGIELVVISRQGFPIEDEIDRVNRAGFSRCTFAVDRLPGPEEGRRLESLQCKLGLTFAVRAYPRFVDKEGLEAVPVAIPFLFSTDYWPGYTHMDVFNLLPHRLRLRVTDSLPGEESLPYLKNIERLDDIRVDTSYDPEAGEWKKFEGLGLTWGSLGHVPSGEALDAFEKSGLSPDGTRLPRKLVIDSDYPWTAEEKARIEKSPLQVEWVRSAPVSWGSRWR